MKTVFIKTFLLLILLFTFSYAQDSKINIDEIKNCPSHFTHTFIKIPKVEISKIGTLGPDKYSTLPHFVLSKDSISKLIEYPEIAIRAGITGDVIFLITIDELGNIANLDIFKGMGAGCDESALNIISKTQFRPATINNENVSSELMIWVSFTLIDSIAKSDFLLDKIIYEIRETAKSEKLLLDKSGRVEFHLQKYLGDNNSKVGTIPVREYTKLSDFIISQCFLKYRDSYPPVSFRNRADVTVTVFYGSDQKSVSSYRNNYREPIGFWAIVKVLEKLQDEIKWEIIE